MGFINATVHDPADAEEDYRHIMAPSETVRFAFKLIRDAILFTDKRIVTIDVQGLTGSKKRFVSIPYRAITTFSVESAGHFDLDTELTLTVSGAAPIELLLSRGTDVHGLISLLTERLAR
ncbi:PH domain-containing protein [Sphingomonas sp.]|jgi:hypothetical protein|uniref:PH domain-containing protein n=1 Tax=Sphingomonas sp. TaxID=28214 RepID=UPI0017FB782A|nr:PH domain-containing protein [Sphingomonas sp.]MBA4760577.1 PH domain-containing protein [Sphingomonas sp.]